MIIIDVGAYNGVPYFKRAKKDSSITVYAFEPNKKMFLSLSNNAPKNYKAFNMIVSEIDGEVDFYKNQNEETNSILPFNKENLHMWPNSHVLKTVNKTKMQSIRLDTFIKKENIKEVDFLKIDAQGADLQVLKSCGEKLDIIKNIQVEVCDIQIYENGNQLEETIEYLLGKNFSKVNTIQHNKTKDIIFKNEKY